MKNVNLTPATQYFTALSQKHSDISVSPIKYKKEKKMNWFKRKFSQWSRDAWENAVKEEADTPIPRNCISGKTSVRFTVYAASGGYVIEHYKQDRFKDSDSTGLTIVSNGESLGTAVEHILTLEALKA